MLSNVVVTSTWNGPSGGLLATGGRITVSSTAPTSGTTYSSTVVFDTLIAINAGTYTCGALVTPSVSLMFNNGSDIAEGDITLNIQSE